MLVFMLARQQNDLLLSGKGVVIFNMELFVSVMQTSYSFYTLIRS
uniref:Putative odorant receptor 47 n=1 Tax=Conopomorpha sinensis TaxID=940481 RepID=A0A3Q8HD88_9NEOP|nr:putative odorant receptor 47 [Conopomorpha sinensis]